MRTSSIFALVIQMTAVAVAIGASTAALANPTVASAPGLSAYPEPKLQMDIQEVGTEMAKVYGKKSVSMTSCVLNHEDKPPVEVCLVNDINASFQKFHALFFHENKLTTSIFAITALDKENGETAAQTQYYEINKKFKTAYGEPTVKQEKSGLTLEWMMNDTQMVRVSRTDNRVLIVTGEASVITSKTAPHPRPNSAYRRAWAYLDPITSDEMLLTMSAELIDVVQNSEQDSIPQPSQDLTAPKVHVPKAFSILQLGTSMEETGRALSQVYSPKVLREIECVTRKKGTDTLETCALLAGFQKIGDVRPHAYQSLMFSNGVLIASYFTMNTFQDTDYPLSKKNTEQLLAGISSKYEAATSSDRFDGVYSWALTKGHALSAVYEDNALSLIKYDKARLTVVTEQDWPSVSARRYKPWAGLFKKTEKKFKMH